MPFPTFPNPGAMLYTQSFASRPENVEVPVYMNRAPVSGAYGDSGGGIPYAIGKRWIYLGNAEYVLLSLTYINGVPTPTWALVTSSGGDIVEFITGSGGPVFPTGTGAVSLLGTAAQIATVGTANTVTFSLIGPYTPATYTAHGVLIGEGAGSIVASAVGTAGQYFTSNGAGVDPSFQTSTPQLVVTPVAGASQAMTSNHTYIANDAALTTFTLPAASSVGDILQIVGSALNTGGWKVTYGAGQIIWGPSGSSTITTGNAASATAAAQVMTMSCVVANTTWVITSNSGTITLT